MLLNNGYGVKDKLLLVMKQEDKELLLKDLCARLPYGVKVTIEYTKDKYTHIYDLREIDNDTTSELRQQVTVWNYGFYSTVISYPLMDCRPYLRPMSSMTEEELKEYKYLVAFGGSPDGAANFTDWLNKNHFDYRDLIPMGLAKDATGLNIY